MVTFKLDNLARLVQLHQSRTLPKTVGASMAEVRVLFWVCELGDCSISELVAASQLDQGNTSRMIEKLVKAGLVVKKENPFDRRASLNRATPAARKLVASYIPQRKALNEELLSSFSAAEVDKLRSMLDKLSLALRDKLDKLR